MQEADGIRLSGTRILPRSDISAVSGKVFFSEEKNQKTFASSPLP
jgi:hypothetical protein